MKININDLRVSNSGFSTQPSHVSAASDLNDRLLTPDAAQLKQLYGGVAVGTPNSASIPAQSNQLETEQKSSTVVTSATEGSNNSNWSTSLQTLLDQPPATLPRKLVLGGVIFCLAFTAWANFGTIDEVGHAQGRLVPQGDVYKIHPVVLGKVDNIAVKEGEVVQAGQVVVELDRDIAANEVQRLQQELAAHKTEWLQTNALIEQIRQEAETHGAVLAAQIKAQDAAIAQAKAQAEAHEVLLVENQGTINTQKQLLQELETDVVAHQGRLAQLQPLLEDGAISQEIVFQREQALRDRQHQITQNKGELQQTRSASNRLQAEQRQAQAELERLQAELAQKQAEGNRTLLESQQKIQQLQVQVTQFQAKINETQNRLTTAKAQLQQLSLKSPVDGSISSLNLPNPGEVVQPGQTIAEIAPQDTPLVLSAILPNREAGFVKTGMPVQVKLDAFPYQDYGIISGEVTSISPDSKPDERLGAVYQVEIALEQNSVRDNQTTISLKAGQTASADIVLRRRRIVDILFDPIKQLQKGGMQL